MDLKHVGEKYRGLCRILDDKETSIRVYENTAAEIVDLMNRPEVRDLIERLARETLAEYGVDDGDLDYGKAWIVPEGLGEVQVGHLDATTERRTFKELHEGEICEWFRITETFDDKCVESPLGTSMDHILDVEGVWDR